MSATSEAPRNHPKEREQLYLLTGASGFIGAHLAARLAREGRRVRCLVREHSDTDALRRLGVELVVGDLADRSSLVQAARGCRYVLHCAALVSDWATTREILATNVEGTRHLLEAAGAAGAERFLHLSSTDIYGHPGGEPIAESHPPCGFGNWYAHSKRAAEREVRFAQAMGALDTVTLRPATVYGPGSREVIGEIVRALAARHMLMIDRGRAVAGLCYVENLVDAALLALSEPAAVGQAFNISDGLSLTWRELLDDLADGLGCPRATLSVPYRPALALGLTLEQGYRLLRRGLRLSTPALLSRQAVQVLGRDQLFDSAKARALLGWRPRVDYAQGLEATLEWLRSEYPQLRA